MRWPWRRSEPDRDGMNAARMLLAKAQADEPRVARIAAAHHRKITENHFGEKFKRAMES